MNAYFPQSRIILFHIGLKACEWTEKDSVNLFILLFLFSGQICVQLKSTDASRDTEL